MTLTGPASVAQSTVSETTDDGRKVVAEGTCDAAGEVEEGCGDAMKQRHVRGRRDDTRAVGGGRPGVVEEFGGSWVSQRDSYASRRWFAAAPREVRRAGGSPWR
jgi:hypothetical protein